MKHIGENVVRIEAERCGRWRIGSPVDGCGFSSAVDLLFHCQGRVVVTGMARAGSSRGRLRQL